ncbi:hypothetical protein H072_8062 [Dactylellina haptotyla CBS 200.50]|uniref:Uncharacterized protein n=1 Tax=Dactylellina haptotyla (strain CBS 200.50) TaxID=1284197 RepID=S8A5L0_DACHA|nr:hypothetical protein H072_8062 [Dactylellina haptotyla CBS 200.50]
MATAYIPTSQMPHMVGQPTAYEIDPVTQQAYPTGYAPNTGQQQIFITTPQPVQVLPHPGSTVFPQYRMGYGHNPNLLLQQSPNVMHMPYAGDIHAHAPPAYTEMDASRFQQQRPRRSSISMNFGPQYGYPASAVPQVHQSMDFAYMDSCLLCRASHPGPHPHGNMNLYEMPPMPGHRYASMEDGFPASGKMRSSGYGSYDPPQMWDPMDWAPNSRGRGRDVRDQWGYGSKPRSNSRPPSRGPLSRLAGGGRLPLPFENNIRVSELSDDDSDDDNMSRGRPNNFPSNLRRPSTNRGRSSSRPRSVNQTSTFI